MEDNKSSEKIESQKEAVVCPITMCLVRHPCLVKTCMWNHEGTCHYKAEASELDLGELKGLSIRKSLLEVRKAKSNITKILILDKYVTWVSEKYPEKEKYSRRLQRDGYVTEAFKASRLDNEAFKISLHHFCLLSKGSVFKKFIEEFPELKRNKLPSILGLRENTISKVKKQFKKVSTRRGKSTSKSKSNEVT